MPTIFLKKNHDFHLRNKSFQDAETEGQGDLELPQLLQESKFDVSCVYRCKLLQDM